MASRRALPPVSPRTSRLTASHPSPLAVVKATVNPDDAGPKTACVKGTLRGRRRPPSRFPVASTVLSRRLVGSAAR